MSMVQIVTTPKVVRVSEKEQEMPWQEEKRERERL